MAASKSTARLLIAAVLLMALCFAVASAEKHKFLQGESVSVWANRVGPFNNPLEYYMYFSLPYCRPEKAVGTHESLGESVSGYELRQTKTDLRFGVDNNSGFLCEKVLTYEEAGLFAYAVQHQYWYQMFIDNLPVWGMVGEVVEAGDSRQLYLYTHTHFDIGKNQDRVVSVSMISENAVPIKEGQQVSFTYSVNWHDSEVPYGQRFNKYLDSAFYEHQIHWFSVFNALMLVVFLLGLVAIVLLRTLRRDYTSLDDAEDDDVTDESGWKLLHRDVFRAPSKLVLFSAIYGSGLHLAVVTAITLILSQLTRAYRGRGTVVNLFILSYTFTAFVSGFFSGRYYADNKGQNWIKTSLVTAALFPAIVAAFILPCNFMAKTYGALAHVPVMTFLILIAMWALVCVTLTFVGTFIGRHLRAGDQSGPSKHRVNQMPRLIPEKPWYLQSWVNVGLGGILPFASIFIELYFLYTAMWHYKYYYVFGFATTIFAILMLVTSCVSVVSTYFLLNNENHRWHWKAFMTGATTGVYVFLYSMFYYRNRTHMAGLLQFVLYTGHTAILSTIIGLLCGGVGYMASAWFVAKIYSGLKVE